MNAMFTFVIIFPLIAVFLIIHGTFYDKDQQTSAQSLEKESVNMSDLKNLKGDIVSIQNNASNYPDWIATGRWKIFQPSTDPQSNINMSANNLNFNASIVMTSIDGINSHRHKLVDFSLSKVLIQNRNAIINGTISFTTSGYDKGEFNKNIIGIPISIRIMNLETMNVQLDNKIFRDNFGNSLIYGTIS